jgi:hypothetical protein
MEYDGVAEVWLDGLEDWKEITAEREFVKAVAGELQAARPRDELRQRLTWLLADEANFILAPIHVMLGYDYLVVGDSWKAAALKKTGGEISGIKVLPSSFQRRGTES